jgi:hypothetical protein
VTATKAPALVPAPVVRHQSMSSVAYDGVAYLVHWLVILLLLGQAITAVVRPPGGILALGLATGFICLMWATFCLGMGLLRGHRPDGSDRPPPGWLGVITTAGCLISLVGLQVSSGLPGPWPAQLLVAGLLVASVTVWAGPVAGGASAIVLGVLALALALDSAPVVGDPLLRTSLATAVPSIALFAAGFSVALALGALGRAASGLQRNLDVREEVLVREQAVREAAQVAAEVERSLHDTALNTLETISAHGDHLDPEVVRERCRSDYAQLSIWRQQTELTHLADVVEFLEAHSRRLGLNLEPALVIDPGTAGDPSGGDLPSIPPPVLAALARAGAEALTNVVKHAGVRQATILARHDRGGAQVFVADEGIGAGGARDGFGVSRSIRERMESVGGGALTGPGPGGRGTLVLLEWRRKPPAGAVLGSGLLLGTARIVLMVATLLAGTASALIVLGWPAYSRPWLAMAAAFAPVVVAAGATERAHSGRRVGSAEVMAACSTYVLVGAVALLADPYCASLLGEGVMLDARAPMMAVILLLAPRRAVLVAIVCTVGLAHLGAALAWSDRWILCGPDTAVAGVYVVAVLGASWLFIERIDRLSAELAVAREEAIAAQVRIGAQLSLRSDEEAWVADTLRSAQGLLDDIAQGRMDPRDGGTRAACASEAEFLRALLAVGQAPMTLRRPARIWLRLLHAHGCRIQLRGSFAALEVPARVVGDIGGVIDMLCTRTPGAFVTLSAWTEPIPIIVLSATGPSVAGAGAALGSQVERYAGNAWHDVNDDGVTIEWTWGDEVPPSHHPSG